MTGEGADGAATATLLRLTALDAAGADMRAALHAAWRAALAEGATPAQFHDAYFAALRTLITDTVDASIPPERAAHFVIAFASSSYIDRFQTKQGFFEQLIAHHPAHLTLLRHALTLPDREIAADAGSRGAIRLSTVADAMIRLYSAHAVFGRPEEPGLRAEARALCPAFLAAFPDLRMPAALSLLDRHPEATQTVARLIRDRLARPALAGDEGNPLWDLGGAMLGHHARRDDPLHANAAAILKAALKTGPALTPQQTELLADALIFGPLDIRPVSQPQAEAAAERSVSAIRRMAQQAPYAKLLARYERDLALIRSDFPLWQQKRETKAARRIAVSRPTRKALDLLAQALPGDRRAPLDRLRTMADEIARRPARFPIVKPADTAFRDFGLKLLVIEELMYRQQVLTPRFDIHAFSEEYSARQISVEDDGYDQIPEALRYFKALPIPPALLEQVTSLHQSSGLDGGPQVMTHLHPFWDPGAGDGPVKVTAKAVEDLALLPNLRRITGLENSAPGPKLRNALKARGIVCLPETG